MRLSSLLFACALIAGLAAPMNALAIHTPAHTGQAQGGSTLDQPFQATELREWVAAVFKLGLTLVIIAAAIFIGIGAYMYFAAAGNAEYAGRGKEYIWRSIMGLVLALISWVILTTISPQFTKELREPTLPRPAAPP